GPLPRPTFLPEWVLPVAGAIGSLLPLPVPVCAESVRVARHGHRLDGSRATRELGLTYTPIEETVRRPVAWSRRRGLLRTRSGGQEPPVASTARDDRPPRATAQPLAQRTRPRHGIRVGRAARRARLRDRGVGRASRDRGPRHHPGRERGPGAGRGSRALP